MRAEHGERGGRVATRVTPGLEVVAHDDRKRDLKTRLPGVGTSLIIFYSSRRSNATSCWRAEFEGTIRGDARPASAALVGSMERHEMLRWEG